MSQSIYFNASNRSSIECVICALWSCVTPITLWKYWSVSVLLMMICNFFVVGSASFVVSSICKSKATKLREPIAHRKRKTKSTWKNVDACALERFRWVLNEQSGKNGTRRSMKNVNYAIETMSIDVTYTSTDLLKFTIYHCTRILSIRMWNSNLFVFIYAS